MISAGRNGDMSKSHITQNPLQIRTARAQRPLLVPLIHIPSAPMTPTPIRRSSNLGPHGQRATRLPSSDDSPISSSFSPTHPTEDAQRPNFKVIEIPSSKLKSTGIHSQIREHMSGLPQELQFELLTKLRVADALTSSLETRSSIIGSPSVGHH